MNINDLNILDGLQPVAPSPTPRPSVGLPPTVKKQVADSSEAIPKKTGSTKPRQRKLTGKQQAFVNELINNPTSTATQAYRVAYKPKETTSKQVIHNHASLLKKQPAIAMELAKYSGMYESVINDTIQDWGHEDNTRKREIATTLAMYAHDKVHGKATQRVQQTSEVVSISINLTGDNDMPPEYIEQI
jgi:uncharacterized membrane protein YfhO